MLIINSFLTGLLTGLLELTPPEGTPPELGPMGLNNLPPSPTDSIDKYLVATRPNSPNSGEVTPELEPEPVLLFPNEIEPPIRRITQLADQNGAERTEATPPSALMVAHLVIYGAAFLSGIALAYFFKK